MDYKLKNNLFTIFLFIILAFVVYFAIWKFAYNNTVCKPINEASAAYGLKYEDIIHTYEGDAEKKYEASSVEPTLLTFNGKAEISEKASLFYKPGSSTNQVILSCEITPKLGGKYEYTIIFHEVSSTSGASKEEAGRATIDPTTFEVIEDNSNGLYSQCTTRIQNLVKAAIAVWGDSIVE